MRVISFQIMILAMFQLVLIFGLTHCASDDQEQQMEEVVQEDSQYDEYQESTEQAWEEDTQMADDTESMDNTIMTDESMMEDTEMSAELDEAEANDMATSEAQDAIAESLVEAVDSETEPTETFEPSVPETDYNTEVAGNLDTQQGYDQYGSQETLNDTSAAASGDRRAYIVQPGDSLSRIAARVYGNQDQWRELAQLNGLNNPNRIFPGDKIYYPASGSTQSFTDNYEALPRENVTVKRGDTLASIASSVYQDSGAWKSLWRQNEDKISNPNFIQVGQVLRYIPAGTLADFMGNPAMGRSSSPAVSNSQPAGNDNIQDVIDTDLGLEE